MAATRRAVEPGDRFAVKATRATTHGLAVNGPDRRDNAAWANEVGVVSYVDGLLRLEFSRGRSCLLIPETMKYLKRA